MKARLGALLLTSCAAVAGCGPAGAQPPATVHTVSSAREVGAEIFPAAQRKPAPDLTGTTLEGHRLSIRSRTGRGIVALNVWASWCGPCREEIPLLARADRHTLTVVGIDEHDQAGKARTFADAHGARYPSLADPDGALLHALPMLPQLGIPSTLFLDERGRVAARVIGPLTGRSLRLVLEQIGTSP